MATLNKVQLMGRLTNEPESRQLPNGGSVVAFRFAVGRSKKNAQTGEWENDKNPLYIDCEAFSRQDSKRDLPALITQYCKKGDSVYIDGRLQLDQWEDKNGGGMRSKIKVIVENIEFLGGSPTSNDSPGASEKPAASTSKPRAAKQKAAVAADEYGGDDNGDSIPF